MGSLIIQMPLVTTNFYQHRPHFGVDLGDVLLRQMRQPGSAAARHLLHTED